MYIFFTKVQQVGKVLHLNAGLKITGFPDVRDTQKW